eukprot:1603486-Rhodomonas_salina.2
MPLFTFFKVVSENDLHAARQMLAVDHGLATTGALWAANTYEMAQLLVVHGAILKTEDIWRNMESDPLCLAADLGNLDVVRALLEGGFMVELRHLTPAVRNADAEMVRLLLQHRDSSSGPWQIPAPIWDPLGYALHWALRSTCDGESILHTVRELVASAAFRRDEWERDREREVQRIGLSLLKDKFGVKGCCCAKIFPRDRGAVFKEIKAMLLTGQDHSGKGLTCPLPVKRREPVLLGPQSWWARAVLTRPLPSRKPDETFVCWDHSTNPPREVELQEPCPCLCCSTYPQLRVRLEAALLDWGVDVNAGDPQAPLRTDCYGGYTALHRAAGEWDAPMVRLLLSRGADANARRQCGLKPLMEACRLHGAENSAGVEVVQMLVNARADVKGSGMLIFAFSNCTHKNHLPALRGIAQVLLEAGASPKEYVHWGEERQGPGNLLDENFPGYPDDTETVEHIRALKALLRERGG